jgi:hypothetical protein
MTILRSDDMVKNHPIRRAVGVLRAWLILVIGVMCWNAVVANGILLEGWMRPLPFWLLAVVGFVWLKRTWHTNTVIWCSSLICVGVLLRALELLIFANEYDMRTRLTGGSLWLAIAGTCVAFGILNVLAISRREAEEWVWSQESS